MTEAWIAPGKHAVQFYVGERFAHQAIAEFFSHGARPDDPLILMSRRRTFQAVADLLAPGYGSAASAADRLRFIDVDVALPQIMNGGSLDPVRARRFFEDQFASIGPVPANGFIRLYGELVDVLCERGQAAAALEMEGIAPALFEIKPRMSILCGYCIERFRDDTGLARMRAVCEKHAHVLPAASVAGAPQDPASRRMVATRSQPPRRPAVSGAVYVIDDDGSMRKSLGRLLARADWAVRTFGSAEAFLNEADGLSVGCVVVDIQLVGMNGLELIGRLAGIRPQWPVIAMSGSHDAEIEFEALRAGARTFLRKPFEPQRLLDEVASALS
jgi:CheY-like chemotaxis protein